MSASPVRCSMNSCGNIATDSNQMEKVQSIYMTLVRLFPHHRQDAANLGDAIIAWKENREHRANSEEVLNLECIDVGIMCGFVVIEHEVDDVGRGTDKQKLERGEVQGVGERPEKI